MNPLLQGGARFSFTSFTSSIYLPQPIEFTYFTMVFFPKISISKENRYDHIHIYLHIIYQIPLFDDLFSIDCIDLSSVIMIINIYVYFYIYIYTYIYILVYIYILISRNMTYIRLYPMNTMKSNDLP